MANFAFGASAARGPNTAYRPQQGNVPSWANAPKPAPKPVPMMNKPAVKPLPGRGNEGLYNMPNKGVPVQTPVVGQKPGMVDTSRDPYQNPMNQPSYGQDMVVPNRTPAPYQQNYIGGSSSFNENTGSYSQPQLGGPGPTFGYGKQDDGFLGNPNKGQPVGGYMPINDGYSPGGQWGGQPSALSGGYDPYGDSGYVPSYQWNTNYTPYSMWGDNSMYYGDSSMPYGQWR